MLNYRQLFRCPSRVVSLMHVQVRFKGQKGRGEVPSYKFQIPTHELHSIIKWERPVEIPHWSPERTCDLQSLPTIDPRWIRLEYRPFTEIIDKLPEEKRKLFTLEFGKRSDSFKLILKDTLALVQRHLYDEESLEYRVTHTTMKIRNCQSIIEERESATINSRFRHGITCLVKKRKSLLDQLRGTDYRRFEWLINLLGIMYKLTPPGNRVERKASIVKLTDLYCEAIRDKKMLEYAEELDEQKVPFLKEKLTTLHFIKKEEEMMDLRSSVDEEIGDTKRLLEKLEKSYVEIQPLDDSGERINKPLAADDDCKKLTNNSKPKKILRQKQKREEDASLYLITEITKPWVPMNEYHMPKCLYGKDLYPRKGIIHSKRWK